MDAISNTPSFTPILAGRIGIAIGIAAVVSIVTLSLLYSGIPAFDVFGKINDLTNAVGGLLSALLAWQFHALLRERAPATALLFLLLAWAGSAAIAGNSLLVAFGQMHWMTGGMYTALGLGLQGIWLFALLRLIGPQAYLTPGLARLGTVAAVAMWFGLLAGPLLVVKTDLNQNPLVWVVFIGAAGGWLLYPLWCWLVGRMLVSA